MEFKLEHLRELNNGYNPERAMDHGNGLLDDTGEILTVNGRTFLNTYCSDEIDYIVPYPYQFGLYFGGLFFKEGEL